eukprot:SAG31_NODE_14781_length_788_cov_0.693759_1_plen_99_part_10
MKQPTVNQNDAVATSNRVQSTLSATGLYGVSAQPHVVKESGLASGLKCNRLGTEEQIVKHTIIIFAPNWVCTAVEAQASTMTLFVCSLLVMKRLMLLNF